MFHISVRDIRIANYRYDSSCSKDASTQNDIIVFFLDKIPGGKLLSKTGVTFVKATSGNDGSKCSVSNKTIFAPFIILFVIDCTTCPRKRYR